MRTLKIFIFSILGSSLFGQTVRLVHDANIVLAESDEIVITAALSHSPFSVHEGNTFNVKICEFDIHNKGVSTSVEYTDKEILDLIAFPNPFGESVKIKLMLKKAETLYFEMYDFSGHKLWESKENASAGSFVKQMDMTDFPSGHYVVLISNGIKKLAHVQLVKMN